MGNCIKRNHSCNGVVMTGAWSDDYSDHLNTNPKKINLYGAQNYTYKKIKEEEDTGALTNDDVYTENMKETTQVRLKITRKQLEELLTESTTNIKGLSVEQVLTHLINVSMHDEFHSHQHHSCRPHLPTITEV